MCVFDYDLTLSSHACPQTESQPAFYCRENTCGTYSWNHQCLGIKARLAVAECVRRKAFIGIASHADRDGCWNDKVIPIITQNQFPEFTRSESYANPQATPSYPAIDLKRNWNCDDCAYQMVPTISKPAAIARIMRHYGMDPDSQKDQRRVIFWDDSPSNIVAFKTNMVDVKVILVPRNSKSGDSGGCGIGQSQIDEAWSEPFRR